MPRLSPPHFSTPLTRFMLPQGAPAEAHMPGSALRRSCISAYPSHVSCPIRRSTKGDKHNDGTHNCIRSGLSPG
eukprot:9209716-Pyramimonas_sp.AAC.1